MSAPGEDGILAEWYKENWDIIKDDLWKAYTHALQQGELMFSQKGIIKLIPKPNKNLLLMHNHRPIILLNIDYKILSKVLANRLKKLLPEIINENQGGFVPGRYIGENIRMMLDVAEEINNRQLQGYLVSLNIGKAFYSVEWDFVEKAMDCFNIGKKFQSWIATLYTNAKAAVMNNGYETETIDLERGVRQGDPISPYIFVIREFRPQ